MQLGLSFLWSGGEKCLILRLLYEKKRKMIGFILMLSRWLARYASAFVIGIAIVTLLAPHLFCWVRSNVQTVILGVIMLSMGLTLSADDFRVLARRPADILIGTCAQFDPRKYLGPARDNMQKLYEHKIVDVLGSENKLANLD